MARIANWRKQFDDGTIIVWKAKVQSIQGVTNYVFLTKTPAGWQIWSNHEGEIGSAEFKHLARKIAYDYMKNHRNG